MDPRDQLSLLVCHAGNRPDLACRPSADAAVPGLGVLPALPLPLLLSPRVRMETPLKLLALVTGGRMLRTEPSESVLLQGRGSRDLSSLSVLLCRLLEVRLSPSRFPLQKPQRSEHPHPHRSRRAERERIFYSFANKEGGGVWTLTSC